MKCLQCRQQLFMERKGLGTGMKELSEAEWHVLESLWAASPKVGSQIVADLEQRRGWSRSTTLTMLRRMTEKGLISCDDGGMMSIYSHLVLSKEADIRESASC